ncbi:hypothetical protein O3P69_018162 [Scylla paramamosain]|uniref:Uncharacterized protein n=1 Tax=Scylla paramamosain TaxID=85552 RepID=A0AAW0TL53_SCYPA
MSTLIDYAPVTNAEGLETSILGLHFRASNNHLKHGMLKLRCTATIAAVYYSENTRVAAARLTERARRPESHGIFAGSGGANGVRVMQHGWPAIVGLVVVLLR